ncbi:MAG: hypothetical protein JW941_06295, partial [Candidatus Coatesbacteria bacterium]|nr:hypothetical protein [Candidatus Coatesbacteria bacterium]
MPRISLFIFLVTSMVAFYGVAVGQTPVVEVSTDSSTYHYGDTGEVLLTVTNGPEEYAIDFYLALIGPDGTQYFYPSWGNIMQPALTGFVLPPDFEMGPFVYI